MEFQPGDLASDCPKTSQVGCVQQLRSEAGLQIQGPLSCY